jgi:hypothetical protein
MAKGRHRSPPKPKAAPGGRKPRPGIVHTSVYLQEATHEALRTVAFHEKCKIHDVILEGIGLALKKRGRGS